MIRFYYFIVLAHVLFQFSSQAYFEGGIIEEPCQKKCKCKRMENSSKVQVAHCVVDLNDKFVQCNVEWPVLMITVKKVIFKPILLTSCQRIKRLMITAESSLISLMPEMFKVNSQLEILVVQAPIRTIETQFLKYLVSLKQLDVSETYVEHLSKSMFLDCPVQDRIRLSSNKIYVISDNTFENCISLIKLDLSHNQLTVINYLTFNKVENLEVLDLSKNEISKIDDSSFKNLKKLRILNLYENKLKIITKDTFGGMENLNHLTLESNRIDFIDDEAFSSLKQIRSINLKNNLLQRLYLGLFMNLDYLNITFSNIKCVLEHNSDHSYVSVAVQKAFEKIQPCSGTSKPVKRILPFVQPKTISNVNEKPITRISIPKKNPIPNIFESFPYLFPMVFGGLAVLLISIIIIAIICHVKNRQINELRLQEIHLPMMQSTL